ncbi:hypothetical protein [Aquimarina sp. AU474]|uniref:hypothetical protein n=1 Tax=Aquimarina sp. AU474 TaxID=2108529 RepID=UPI001357F639|nr:hypothetical protein [Aquimarina sp. AU474]
MKTLDLNKMENVHGGDGCGYGDAALVVAETIAGTVLTLFGGPVGAVVGVALLADAVDTAWSCP